MKHECKTCHTPFIIGDPENHNLYDSRGSFKNIMYGRNGGER
jgi:hypothetical protein